jgi:MFS family permease
VLWVATVVSNIGTWMQNAAAGWLMTSLDPDPFVVSLVQVATSLPLFLFALPAGALADIVDRRKLLIVVQVALAALVAAFGLMVWLGQATPHLLLAFTFLAATAASLIMPAWQSIVPQLVPREHLQPAVALNSVGLNVSRAVGPALAGIIIAAWGIAAPFWVNALSTLGVIAALVWWRPRDDGGANQLPPEQFHRAVGAGLRHARYNPHLRATLIRAAAAAFALPWLKRHLGADRLVVAGTFGTAIALLLFAIARQPATALAASVIAGVSWIAVLATINVSAQVALPGWVRGRGLSIFGTVMFGSLTLGSVVWGKVAALTSLPATHLAAALGALIAVPLLWRWKLQTAYQIRPEDRGAFLDALRKLAGERRRDGAFEWGVFEDVAQPGRLVETFMLDSWIEHLRQHQRVTQADRGAQEAVNRFQVDGTPKVSHLIATS